MKRSKFSLSHYVLRTANMGMLSPIGCFEVLPGDSIQQATSMLVRCQPLVAPPMHPVHVKIHHWFVPNRIIWDDWEDFITGGADGMDASVHPTISMAPGSVDDAGNNLANALGVPPIGTNTVSVNALPFRAYAMIFNEWYRDQDLCTLLPLSLSSGVDSTTNTNMVRSAWEKDYFTTARPWEVKGPSITLPLGTSAPLDIGFEETGTSPGAITLRRGATGTGAQVQVVEPGGTALDGIIATGTADLSTATSVTINVLREALALQRYEEARARFGSRYTEYLRYLGVKSSDARLQRPEYLGGGKQTIQFSEVLSTNKVTDQEPGLFGGHGIAAMRTNRYRRFFEEHGWVISLMTVLPKTIYLNSLPRAWRHRTKEDYWQRELQHIGQQEVHNAEVFGDLDPGTGADELDGVFGFQDRYDEYRRLESRVGGGMMSTFNAWHFARAFTDVPTLNADFVSADPSVEPFADQSSDTLIYMANHNIQARRLVSQRGNSLTF